METERLVLRKVELADAQNMFLLDADPEVQRYVGNQPQKTIDESIAVINFIHQQYNENGIGRWAVLEKSTNEFLGWCGLKLVKETHNNQTNFYDLGYRFIRKHWGKGYATESAQAWLQYGFHQMNLQTINAMADVENSASDHVLRKLGLQQINIFDLDGIPHNWYEITKTDFINKQSKQNQ